MTTSMNAALPVSTALVPTTADGMDLPGAQDQVDGLRCLADVLNQHTAPATNFSLGIFGSRD